jgi:hypothetical protein
MPLHKEDLEHKALANYITSCESLNRVNPNLIWWTYNAGGEKRPSKINKKTGQRYSPTGKLLKAKGLKKGFPDYMFFLLKGDISEIIFLEMKTEKGILSKMQLLFQQKVSNIRNIKHYVPRSAVEAIKILERTGVLLNDNNEYSNT